MGLCVGSLLWICLPPSRVAPREQRPQGRAQGTRAILNRHLSPAEVAKIFFPLSLPFSAPGSPESSAWRVTAAAAMIFAHSGRRSLRARRGKALPARPGPGPALECLPCAGAAGAQGARCSPSRPRGGKRGLPWAGGTGKGRGQARDRGLLAGTESVQAGNVFLAMVRIGAHAREMSRLPHPAPSPRSISDHRPQLSGGQRQGLSREQRWVRLPLGTVGKRREERMWGTEDDPFDQRHEWGEKDKQEVESNKFKP